MNRVVVYSLRASQAYSPTRRMTNGLIIYMQVSLGLGYIGISNDLVNLLRCLLVNPTYGSELYEESPAAATKGGVMTPPPEGTPDLKKTRFWARRFTDVCNLSFIAATVTGAIASSKFDKAMENQVTANSVATLRCVRGFSEFPFHTQTFLQDCKWCCLPLFDARASMCRLYGKVEAPENE